MDLKDLKEGDTLIMEIRGRRLEVNVGKIDHQAQQFMAQFGPVPFSSLPMLSRKEGA